MPSVGLLDVRFPLSKLEARRDYKLGIRTYLMPMNTINTSNTAAVSHHRSFTIRTTCAACSLHPPSNRTLSLREASIPRKSLFRACGQRHLSFNRIACSASTDSPSLQLATAKLPKELNVDTFKNRMYEWASTMTSSGRNMPFSLPLRTRKTSDGFEMSLLRINNGEPVAVGTVAATVEEVPGTGTIFFVRFYEGEGASLVRNAPLPKDSDERLKIVINGLVDIPMIMGTMRTAIRQAVGQTGKK